MQRGHNPINWATNRNLNCIGHWYILTHSITGLILGLRPVIERCCYEVTPSLIGWVQTLSQPSIFSPYSGLCAVILVTTQQKNCHFCPIHNQHLWHHKDNSYWHKKVSSGDQKWKYSMQLLVIVNILPAPGIYFSFKRFLAIYWSDIPVNSVFNFIETYMPIHWFTTLTHWLIAVQYMCVLMNWLLTLQVMACWLLGTKPFP